MRTSILLFLLACPLLVASGAVLAKASSTEIGKPVCTHFDESTKPAASGAADPAAPAASATVGAPTVAPAAAVIRSGGSDSMSHPRPAPHWQTFLPGMFR